MPGLSKLARLTAGHDNGKVVELVTTLLLRDLRRAEKVLDCQERALDVILVGILPQRQGDLPDRI